MACPAELAGSGRPLKMVLMFEPDITKCSAYALLSENLDDDKKSLYMESQKCGEVVKRVREFPGKEYGHLKEMSPIAL